MAKKELNLLQFAAGGAAEPSATSPEIVQCDFVNANLGGELLDDMPDELFRYSFAPSSTGATHTPESFSASIPAAFVQSSSRPCTFAHGPSRASPVPNPIAVASIRENTAG